MTLTIDIKDNVADKILYLLEQIQDIQIITPKIEIISKKDEDYQDILKAREKRKNGEKLYSLDEIKKEFL